MGNVARGRAVTPLFVICLASFAAVVLAISQTGAVYDGDEGLHLIAALLVRSGQQPFVDFFYWHQPLYLYVVATWMAIVGESWRGVHLLSALFTAAAALLIGSYTPGYVRAMKGPGWWGIVSAACFALNVLVLKWGTIGHNYALCLMLSTIAFRLAASAVDRPDIWRSFWTGFFAGAAAATTLLVILLIPVVLIWLVASSRSGARPAKAASFLLGAVIPFVPLALLAFAAPNETYFGLVEHHLTYRVPVTDAAAIHVETLISWTTSPQALLLIVLAAVGVQAAARTRSLEPVARRDAYLCLTLVISLGVFAALAHPPARMPYFVVITPFVAILASIGLFAVVRRTSPVHAEWIALTVVVLFGLGALRSIYRERLWTSEWRRIEAFAEEVNRVATPGESFYTSFPFVYFAAGRLPPEGLENGWATRMVLSLDSFAQLEVMPDARLTAYIRSGFFDATLLGRADPRYDSATMDRVYSHNRMLDPSFVLRWQPRRSRSPTTAEPVRQERR